MKRALGSGWAVAITALLSIVTTLVVSRLLRTTELPDLSRLLVALVPVPFTALFIVAEIRALQRLDEFGRQVILESLAVAFPISILGAVTIELLQRAGFASSLEIGDVWPFMPLVWLAALAVVWVRYRS